jgi:hypothetical protein
MAEKLVHDVRGFALEDLDVPQEQDEHDSDQYLKKFSFCYISL